MKWKQDKELLSNIYLVQHGFQYMYWTSIFVLWGVWFRVNIKVILLPQSKKYCKLKNQDIFTIYQSQDILFLTSITLVKNSLLQSPTLERSENKQVKLFCTNRQNPATSKKYMVLKYFIEAKNALFTKAGNSISVGRTREDNFLGKYNQTFSTDMDRQRAVKMDMTI